MPFFLPLLRQVEFLKLVGVIAVFLFVVMFATGPGSIPWFLVSELFAVNARGLASSLAVSINWGANFIVGLSFLPINVSCVFLEQKTAKTLA